MCRCMQRCVDFKKYRKFEPMGGRLKLLNVFHWRMVVWRLEGISEVAELKRVRKKVLPIKRRQNAGCI